MRLTITHLREALEACWDERTSYRGAFETTNPAFGQCYPTSRVIQIFFPEIEIAEGEVWTGKNTEKHFWNLLRLNGMLYHTDFTWQQFPNGSVVTNWRVRDRATLGDRQITIDRVNFLLSRVASHIYGLPAYAQVTPKNLAFTKLDEKMVEELRACYADMERRLASMREMAAIQ